MVLHAIPRVLRLRMRENTCSPWRISLKVWVTNYPKVARLSLRLQSFILASLETNKRDISEEKLRDSLLAAVSSLPSCDIKNDLVDNFEAVFDKLEKFRYICKQQPTHVTMDLTGVDKLTTCLTGISNEPAHKMRNELCTLH